MLNNMFSDEKRVTTGKDMFFWICDLLETGDES